MDNLTVRVLVVDDEDAIRDLLEFGLGQAGFAVRSVPSGQEALQSVRDWMPEAIVLDVMLPQVDGYSLLPMFRRLTQAPILMLSAKGSAPDKVSGLIRGADDYLAKPFNMDELIARIHSALRRPHLELREMVRYADLAIDVPRRVVVRANREIDLSQREFDLLLVLVKNPNRVFTRADLLDHVWGIDKDVGPSAVDTYISYLRAKIDAGSDRKLIHTVRGVGYTVRDRSA